MRANWGRGGKEEEGSFFFRFQDLPVARKDGHDNNSHARAVVPTTSTLVLRKTCGDIMTYYLVVEPLICSQTVVYDYWNRMVLVSKMTGGVKSYDSMDTTFIMMINFIHY